MGLLVVLALFTACSDDSSDINSSFYSKSSFEELNVNYNLLNMLYIYNDKYHDLASNVNAYVGKGTKADAVSKFNQRSCTEGYYDVCYMFNQLVDPYTRYFDPFFAPRMIEQTLSSVDELVFLGAEYAIYDDENGIFEITEANADAQENELHVGDLFSAYDVAPLVEGLSSDTINISFNVIRTPGVVVTINTRATRIKRPTVRLHYEKTEYGDSIPVIKITEFDRYTEGNGGTYDEFVVALEQTKGSKSVIIDLRDNGGGDTEHCNAAAAEFLSIGDTITIDVEKNLYTLEQLGQKIFIGKLDTTVVVAKKNGMAKDRYVVMLANGNSASCAELMLSAIASNKKSPIVGRLTYGKQIGQSVIYKDPENNDIPEDVLSLFPKGLTIITSTFAVDKEWKQYQDVGIVPDYEIVNRQEQMKKAVQIAAAATEVRVAGYGTERLGHFAKTSEVPNGKPLLRNMKMRYKFLKY